MVLWPTPARADSKAAPRGPRGLTPVLGEGQGVDDGLAQHREEQPAAVGTPAPRLQGTEGTSAPATTAGELLAHRGDEMPAGGTVLPGSAL